MNRAIVAYVATLIVFVLVDFIWLGFIAKDLYRDGIGHLLADQPDWTAAVLFYLLFIGGLIYFAVAPALEVGAWQQATLKAAVFGLIAYATYDLTNQATLKGWPVSITIADLLWGAFVSATASTAGYFVARSLAR